MAETTIEWTATYQDGVTTPGFTFNPWVGCTHVSPGCLHCYAETLMDSRYQKAQWGKGKPRIRTSDANWRKPLLWNKRAAATGRRAKVFCASLADVFDPEVPDDWRFDLYNLMLMTPRLDWLVLTKRIDLVKRMVPGGWLLPPGSFEVLPDVCGWPAHIWLGTSVEDQRRADERIPHLLGIPAAIRFLSCEPLLGPITLPWCSWCGGWGDHDCYDDEGPAIHWVIAGAESGTGARPMDERWVRALKEQCQDAGIPFFLKQFAIKGKKRSLPELDGRQWTEMPEVTP